MSSQRSIRLSKRRDVDMTVGNTVLHIIRFAFPLLLGNLFQISVTAGIHPHHTPFFDNPLKKRDQPDNRLVSHRILRSVNFYFTDESEPSLVIIQRRTIIAYLHHYCM